MAIVSVLWSIGLLAILAVSLLWSGNISYRLARNGFDFANLSTLAEAVINRTILGVTDARPDRRWRADGVAQKFDFDGIPTTIYVQDELGRIDLNRADAGLLGGLLRSVGLDAQSASAMTDKILDWRDQGQLKHLNGAKLGDYRAAGYAYGPRNGAFQSVDELLLVMDMTPALFKRLQPALTVYSGRQFIDPQVAPREALLALPDMDAAKVGAIVTARLDPASRPPPAGPAADALAPLQGRAFSIRAELGRSAARYVHEAAVRLTGDPSQPYWILKWQTVADEP
jgi:general secretion pathway protein K